MLVQTLGGKMRIIPANRCPRYRDRSLNGKISGMSQVCRGAGGQLCSQHMSGQKKGSSDGRAPGGGGYAKSGKPRPGTGGNRRDRLQGKGPTPPAHMRTGHPAQRAATAAPRAAAAGRPARRAEEGRGGVGRERSEYSDENPAARGSGDGAEVVAGRNSVVESLRAAVPAVALYITGRA